MTGNTLTRRHFSQLLAASAASTLFTLDAFASTPTGYAHIASSEHSGTIHTFAVSNSHWHPIQSLPVENPTHLELHPTLPILYAVHDVPLWHHLPRGAVSAYEIAPIGHLTLLHTQPLSLAATNPRHAAISPDGTCLAVLSPGTGIYNILPLAPDGALQPPTIIRKQLNLPQTHALLFHENSRSLFTIGHHRQPINRFLIDHDFLTPAPLETTPTPNPATPPSAMALVNFPTSFVVRPA